MNQMILKSLLLKSGFGKAINSAVGLLVILAVPKLVGADDYGKYVVTWGVIVLIAQLSALGLPIIYVRRGVDYLKTNDINSMIDVNGFVLLTSIVLLPFWLFLILTLNDDLLLGPYGYVYTVISALFFFLFRIINGYNRGCGEVLYSQISDVALRGVVLISVALFLSYECFSFFKDDWQAVSIFVSLGIALSLAITVARKNGFIFMVSLRNFSLKECGRQFGSSLMIFSGNDIRKVEEQMMYVFVGSNIGFAEAAILAISARVNDICLFFMSSANYAIVPKIRLYHTEMSDNFSKAIVSFFVITVASLVAFLPLYFYLEYLVDWYYGGDFARVVDYVSIYLAAIVISSFIGPAQNIATMINLESTVFKVNVVVCPLAIVSMWHFSLEAGVTLVLAILLFSRILGQLIVALGLRGKHGVDVFPISNIIRLISR